MDEQQVLDLINSALDRQLPEMLKGALSEFQSYFEERLKAYEAPPPATEDDPVANRLKILEAKLAEAEQREKQRIQEAQDLHFQNTLGSAIAAKGSVLHQRMVAEILTNRLKPGAILRDNEWYTKDGLKLSEAVEQFFGTDEGLHFLPSGYQNGTATPAAKQPQVAQDIDLNYMIKNMTI